MNFRNIAKHMKGLLAAPWKGRVTLAWKGNLASNSSQSHDAPAAREIMVAVLVPAHARDSGGQRDRGGGAGGPGLLFLHPGCRDRRRGTVRRRFGGSTCPGPELHAAPRRYE